MGLDEGLRGQIRVAAARARQATAEKDAARLPPDADVWALRTELRLTGEAPLLAAARALLAGR